MLRRLYQDRRSLRWCNLLPSGLLRAAAAVDPKACYLPWKDGIGTFKWKQKPPPLWRSRNRQSASIAHEDPLLGELLAEFLERQVWCGLKRRGDCDRVRFGLVRAVVAANRPRRGVPPASAQAPATG
jgi:hypothetical protein